MSNENKDLEDELNNANNDRADKLFSANKGIAEELVNTNYDLAGELITVNNNLAEELNTINNELAYYLGIENKDFADKLSNINKDLADKLIILNKKNADQLVFSNKKLANELVLSNKKLANELVLSNKKLANELVLSNKKLADKLKTINKKLRNVEEKLNQSQKMETVGQLAGGMAHDFNNILNGIMNAAQLLQSFQRNLDDKSREYVELILQSSLQASNIIKKLMFFARKDHISSEPVNIHKVLDDTIQLLEGTLDKKIIININKKAERIIILGDSSSMENIFLNICINASNAMSNGGEIEISTENTFIDQTYCDSSTFNISVGEYLKIDVKDSGTGISPENIEKIFEPFFTTKEFGKGTGLGLSAVYGIIQDHFGEITVVSNIVEGTIFHILLPVTKEIYIKKQIENVYTSNKETILFVDDVEINRILGKELLESLGYKVKLASNGKMALDIYSINSNDIDVVILDMIMPVMNGHEAFIKLKEMNEDCKVIISSGFTEDDNIDSLKKSGLSGFIYKPYKISDLSNLLRQVLTSS